MIVLTQQQQQQQQQLSSIDNNNNYNKTTILTTVPPQQQQQQHELKNNNNRKFHFSSCCQQQETALSKLIIGKMHCQMNEPRLSMSQATSFVWTIHNPITRVVSWYYFSNPLNCGQRLYANTDACSMKRHHDKPDSWPFLFFHYCFPTKLSEFIKAIHDESYTIPETKKNKINVDCHKLAQHTIRGQAKLSNHLFYNYQRYWNRTVKLHSNYEIWAVRTEWLWQDLQHVEYILGGNATYDNFSSVTHGSEKQALQKESLDSTLLQQLCCALQSELQVYFTILQQAVNLDKASKQETTEMVLQKTCNVSSMSELQSTCNDGLLS